LVDNRFVEYFNKWRAKGYSSEQIRDNLLKHGFDSKLVEDAMIASNAVSATTISQSISSTVSTAGSFSRKKLVMTILLTVLVLAVTVLAVYVIYNKDFSIFGLDGTSGIFSGLRRGNHTIQNISLSNISEPEINTAHNLNITNLSDNNRSYVNQSRINLTRNNLSNTTRFSFGGGSGGSSTGGSSGGGGSGGGDSTPAPTCSDDSMNGDETGVDCGGSCSACPSCSDGINNQDETGIDCGGSCEACSNFIRTFYVSNTGNDSNNGTTRVSPWKTISKVNGYTFLPGDGILFKRGDTFYGTIILAYSGNTTAPITYSAYSVGDKPIISGFTTISNWANVSEGIYSASTTAPNTLKIVTINGVNTPKGRYPNANTTNGGYLTFESYSGQTSITDNQLNDTINWTGAEVVVRTTPWSLETKTITSHINSTLTFPSLSWTIQTANGYFFQNDIKALDSFGEWSIKNGTIYMYFGVNNSPTNYVIKASATDNVVDLNGKNYITLDGLNIQGANEKDVLTYGGTNVTIKNSEISLSGQRGIHLQGVTNGIIDNCTIHSTNGYGIRTYLGNVLIENNTLTDIALFEGMGTGVGEHDAISLQSDNSIVRYNNITNVGYNGIMLVGNNIQINNNFIDTFNTILTDGGGIYTADNTSTGRTIKNNIVLNGISNLYGTTLGGKAAFGIYLDSGSENIAVENNTIAHIDGYGLFLHSARYINVTANTIYNCTRSQFLISHDSNSAGYANMAGINIFDNIFVSKNTTQLVFKIYSEYNDYNFGAANNNVYARPINDTNTISVENYSTYNDPIAQHNLIWWKIFSGYDINSNNTPVSINDTNNLRFEYNPTKTNKTITLDTTYIDVKGIMYSGNLTLLPFSSIILMKNYTLGYSPTCNDSIQNGNETGIDCGGNICEACSSYIRTFYISNSGNDSNNGNSSSSPWKTIAKVNAFMASFVPGDGILFKKGDTWNGTTITIGVAGNSSNHITLGAYGSGNKPILSGPNNSPAIQVTAANRGYWTIDGLDLRASGITSGLSNSNAIYFDYWPGDMGAVPEWIIQNSYFDACIFVSGPNMTIKNNIFDGSGKGENDTWAVVVRGNNGNGVLIEGNTIHDYYGRGIWIYNGVSYPIVRNNTIYNIKVNGDFEGHGINFDGYGVPGYYAKAYNNNIYNCDVIGINNENNYYAEYYNNLIHDCGNMGLDMMWYDANRGVNSGVSIHNNIVYNCPYAFRAWDAAGYTLANNIFYNNNSIDSYAFYTDTSTYASNITYVNNIIAGNWTYPIYVPDTKNIWAQFDYNIIIPNGTTIMRRSGSSLNLTQVKALGFMTHGFTSDPLFVNPISDFRLQAGSPAISAGINISGITTDYNGVAYNSTPSIGAFEYVP